MGLNLTGGCCDNDSDDDDDEIIKKGKEGLKASQPRCRTVLLMFLLRSHWAEPS